MTGNRAVWGKDVIELTNPQAAVLSVLNEVGWGWVTTGDLGRVLAKLSDGCNCAVCATKNGTAKQVELTLARIQHHLKGIPVQINSAWHSREGCRKYRLRHGW